MKCKDCQGRGWNRINEFSDECKTCRGTGGLSFISVLGKVTTDVSSSADDLRKVLNEDLRLKLARVDGHTLSASPRPPKRFVPLRRPDDVVSILLDLDRISADLRWLLMSELKEEEGL